MYLEYFRKYFSTLNVKNVSFNKTSNAVNYLLFLVVRKAMRKLK
jgi:hypothetical protein